MGRATGFIAISGFPLFTSRFGKGRLREGGKDVHRKLKGRPSGKKREATLLFPIYFGGE